MSGVWRWSARKTLLPGLLVLTLLAAWGTAAPAAASELTTYPLPSELVNPADEPGFKNPNRPSDLRVNVLTPDGYDPQNAEGYPLLLLLHGANGYHRTWAADLHVAELAAGFPGVIVMPDGGVFGMYSDWNNRGQFGKPQWMKYHLDEVLGMVEEKYRIRPGRRWHAVAGVSMGGQGALRYGSARPGYFGSVAAFSAAPIDNKRPEILPSVNISGASIGEGATFEDLWGPPGGYYAIGSNPQDLIPNLTNSRVFVTSGDGMLCPGDPLNTNPGDMALESVLRIHATAYAAAAEEAGVDVTEERTCGAHSYETTQRALTRALAWGFFEEVPADPRDWRYLTVAPDGDAHGVRFDFKDRPTTVIEFTRSGDQLQAAGAGDVRIRFGDKCDFDLKIPFQVSIGDCMTPPPGPGPGTQPEPRLARLKLARKGSVLRVRSVNGPVTKVALKLFSLRKKPQRKLIMRKPVGTVGAKTKRVRLKLRKGARYLAVASGRQADRKVTASLRFRLR